MSDDKVKKILLLIKNKDFSLAEKQVRNLIQLNSENYQYHNLLAVVFLYQKKYLGAESILKNILSK